MLDSPTGEETPPKAETAAATVEPSFTLTRLSPAEESDFDLWLEAGRTEKHYWLDLWRYRELFFILAWRDVAIRYKQTVAVCGLGDSPAVPEGMIIMTLVFGKVAGLPSEGAAPYPPTWSSPPCCPGNSSANSLSTSSLSLVGNANLISKVYFPRMIIPTSAVVVALVDFFISFSILAGMLVWYQFAPTWRMLALPGLVLPRLCRGIGTWPHYPRH